MDAPPPLPSAHLDTHIIPAPFIQSTRPPLTHIHTPTLLHASFNPHNPTQAQGQAVYPHKFHVSLGIPTFVEQYQGLEVGSKYVHAYACMCG